MTKYHTNIPAASLLLFQGKEVLLMRRYNTGYADGMYGFPAGHVEKDENFTDCIIREAEEEIGITLSRGDLELVHIGHQRTDSDKDAGHDRINAIFVADIGDKKVQNMEPHKCDHVEWFDLENLPDNMIPYLRNLLEEVRQKNFYSEFGW